MILFVSAIINDDGTVQQCQLSDVPMYADTHEDGRRNLSAGMVRLKDGVNPHTVRDHLGSDGAGGVRINDSINEIALLCCRRTPATREDITAALKADGQDCMHIIASTWLAEKLPAEYDDYYGQKLKSHPRAVALVKAMIHKAAHGQPLHTNFKKHLRAEARINEPTESDKK